MSEKTPMILVVDDDPFVREIMELVLQESGYGVETAADGAEALEKYRSGMRANAIVSDMNMPGMSGMELTRELRGIDVDIPIIVLTGDGEISAAAEAVANGANECLVKDEDIQDTIILVLEKVLKEYRLKKESSC